MKKELELFKKLNKSLALYNATMERFNFVLNQLNLALTLLIRIRKRYPYIFGECVTDEEVDNLCGGDKK